MPTITPPRAILFDWDNTLVDTWPVIHSALNETLRYMGHEEWSFERTRREVKKSMRESFPDMFGERWQEAGDVFTRSYRALHLEKLQALPGVEEMLAAIPRERVFVGVVSNKQSKTLAMEVPALGWEKFFNVWIGAGDAARDKPHADPALLALKDSGVEAGAHVWFVGDTGADLGCAQSGGFTPILYGDMVPENGEFDGYPFAAHARNQQELRMLITNSLAANAA